jgi:hypothetical protein
VVNSIAMDRTTVSTRIADAADIAGNHGLRVE